MRKNHGCHNGGKIRLWAGKITFYKMVLSVIRTKGGVGADCLKVLAFLKEPTIKDSPSINLSQFLSEWLNANRHT